MIKTASLSLFTIFFWVAYSSSGYAQETTKLASKPADIRLVIDVSGSMKRNDPNNLRGPAVDLLVKLLPDGSKAGVWTFGQWVNMLVPHKPVSDSWRNMAISSSSKINSVGLYTNIGRALEKAAYDMAKPNPNYQTSLILLTDGMVDIDKNPTKNKAEWRRITDEILPKLKRSGYTVHTVALSNNADIDLMNKLSLSTDGIVEVANTADELMKIFLKAFDVSSPAEQVPLSNNSFNIDSSVEEFTALMFRQNPKDTIQLVGPDQETLSSASSSRFINWYRAENYDLVTIKQPLEGEWSVIGDMDPESRVTVVSNLNLRVKPLPNNVFQGAQFDISYFLQEDGKIVTRPEFLSVMEVKTQLLAGNDEFDLQELWSNQQDTQSPPSDGKFAEKLPAFSKEGIYQLSIQVDGKSFIREFNHQFSVRQPFGADVRQQFNEGNLEYILTANSYSNDVDFDDTQVVAVLLKPNGRKKIRPLSATGLDSWQATILPEEEGLYTAKIKIKGKTKSGQSINEVLEDISFNYSIEGGFKEKQAPFFDEPKVAEKPKQTPTPKITADPVEVQEEKPVESEEKNIAAENESLPSWLLYTMLGAGNILLFGLGFFAFKKIMGGPKSDDVLDEFSEENVAKAVSETEAEPELIEEDEEPPMEDLEPIEEETEPQMEEIEVADEEEPEMEDLSADIETEDIEDVDDIAIDDIEPIDAESKDNIEEPDVNDDGLDDLDAMALEAEDEQAIEEELSQEEEEEDMVAAMLKAQGLDLAEDELDDAISSLIDDLDRDDD